MENLARHSFWSRPFGPAITGAILTLLVYAVTLGGTYTFDDEYIARDETRLVPVVQWSKYWTSDYWNGGVDNLYRPLASTSFAVQKWLHGDRAWAFHLVNLLVAAGACAMVAELARRGAGRSAGYVAGLLFAAHPIHAELICTIVGRSEMMATAGVLGGVLLLIRRPLTAWGVAGVLGCEAFAILSKEDGLVFPLIAGLSVVLLWESPPGPWEKSRLQVLVLSVCWATAMYLLVREHYLKFDWDRTFLDWTLQPMVRSAGADRWLMPVVVLGHYFRLLVWPSRLSPDYGGNAIGSVADLSDPYLWLGMMAVLIWIGWTVAAAMRRQWFVLFCLLGVAISYAMISDVVSLLAVLMSERLIYMTSAFFVMAVAVPIGRLPARPRVVLLAVLVVLGSVRTVTYAVRWNDQLSLYRTAAQEQPGSALLCTKLGELLDKQGKYAEAEQVLLAGAARMPDSWAIWNQLGLVVLHEGRLDDADRYLRRGLAYNIGVMNNIAKVDEARKRLHMTPAGGNAQFPRHRGPTTNEARTNWKSD